MEVRPGEEGEWDSIWGGESVHYRPDNGEPIPSRMDQYHAHHQEQARTKGAGQFSTFLAAPGHAPPLPHHAHAPHPLAALNNANKRSSYAPPPSHGPGHGPQSSDFLFGAPRFQERYRSNSMDSILVQDMSRAVFQPPPPDKLAALPQLGPGPRHYPGHGPPLLIPTAPGHPGLEKRPTFDNIDKRASWSTDKGLGGHYAHAHYPGPHPVYGPGPAVPHPQSKKPIPLPRSKIPVATKAATIERSAVQPEMRTFKRSKTDLSLNMLTSYKAGRAAGSGSSAGSGKNGPLLNFVKTGSNPGKPQQKSAQLRSRPSNRSNRPAVISEESHRAAASDTDSKQSSDSLVISERHLFSKFKMNKASNNNKLKHNSVNGSTAANKPAIREKPSMAGPGPAAGGVTQPQHAAAAASVIHNKSAAALIDKKSSAAAITRHRSESDLLRLDTSRPGHLGSHQRQDDFLEQEELETDPETEDMKISLKIEAQLEKRRSVEHLVKKSESRESLNLNTRVSKDVVQQQETQTPAPELNHKKKNNTKVTNEKFLDMEDTLPDPPPTPPGLKKTEDEEVSEASKPLIISTEPMSVSSSSANKSEDKSNCSSYDSLDGSLDSGVSGPGCWPEGGDWLGTEPSRDRAAAVKSPNSSTCSRSPPTPPPQWSPVRHVMTDWDEFLDTSSGRKFYYNSRSHEKSWKPPRKPRCSSDGYSAPTSPDPCTDQSFDMITEYEAAAPGDTLDNANTSTTSTGSKEKVSDRGETVTAASAPLNKNSSAQSESVDNVPSSSLDTASALDNAAAAEEPVPSGYEVRHETGEDGEQEVRSDNILITSIYIKVKTELFSR